MPMMPMMMVMMRIPMTMAMLMMMMITILRQVSRFSYEFCIFCRCSCALFSWPRHSLPELDIMEAGKERKRLPAGTWSCCTGNETAS